MHVPPTRIAQGIIDREVRYLSRAITLTESTRPEHTKVIGDVLREVKAKISSDASLVETKNFVLANHPRIAVSGPPGVGKSCLLESLGMHCVEKLKKSVGILAVDPSDAERGGSILGDKTRMERLSHHPNAFVRPSPSRGALGGVTARAWEALEVFEAAKFDFTFVETVGVGQSEIEAKNLTDIFVLLVPPLGGDDLQGVKRGIVQAADIIVVTKADPDTPQQALAEQAVAFYRRAAAMMNLSASQDCTKHARQTEVLSVSSKTGAGIDKLADVLLQKFKEKDEAGLVTLGRQQQRLKHFKSYFEQAVIDVAKARLDQEGMFEAFENSVATHRLTPREAGNEALKRLGFYKDFLNGESKSAVKK
jgi:LAO/AO transport system kinase